MGPKKYGTVLYLDLSTEGKDAFEASTGFPFKESPRYPGNVALETYHLAGVSNKPDNHFNGLPVVHVFPANTLTAQVQPSKQHSQGGGGLAIPYEGDQSRF